MSHRIQEKGDEKSLHIAPMLDVSNREFRQLFRILSNRCVLWTEMVVDETIMFTNDVELHLGYDHPNHEDFEITTQQPIICQIGGNTPEYAAFATKLVEQFGYQEINLNVDCPSARVSGKREFGAVLMKKVDTALAMIQAMKEHVTNIPISVKCRVGVDENDDLEYVVEFIERLQPYCTKFYIHARKCILGGLLTPAQNRKVPPLNYPRVYQLCRRFPQCEFWINGGIPTGSLRAAKELCYGVQTWLVNSEDGIVSAHSEHRVPCQICNHPNGSCVAPLSKSNVPPNLRGCMIGRAAMENPSLFWDIDRYFYDLSSSPCRNRREVLDRYLHFIECTYPRRCCDNDPRKTVNIPSPNVIFHSQHCFICQEFFVNPEQIIPKQMRLSLASTNCRELKISSRVIDRSLKPILGIFFGLPKSKTFRRVCDQLSRDQKVRNCGPAYIIKKALTSVPAYILDEDFIRTEETLPKDVPIGRRPQNDPCSL